MAHPFRHLPTSTVKTRKSQWITLAAVGGVVLVSATLIATAPKHPAALLRVVDATGRPITGATILPEGLRTKPGPYRSGWYGWRSSANGVPNPAVSTDQDGYAYVPYPKFVFEEIETGTLCLAVNHPDFVPDRPERIVATAPPAGAPWRVRLQDLWDRIRHKALIARPDPIVLQKGATLKVTAKITTASTEVPRWFVQASGLAAEDTNFWIRPEPGMIITRRLAAGLHAVRAVGLGADGSAWFSDVVPITAVTGQTNELVLVCQQGITVRGQLDDSVARPVRQGRVVAHVWPPGLKPETYPPEWHAWANVEEDGAFEIKSLPAGELEIVALCDGFVSTNGPGQFHMRYPQKHLLGTNDLALTIGMEPTARLEVKVTDEAGQPLKDAQVATWPNVRYGEWSATILVSDRYNTSDLLLAKPDQTVKWGERVEDFQGITDVAGLAILRNLPPDVAELAVEHPQFALPAVASPDGSKHRQATFTLVAGQTNHLSLQLEPRDRSSIRHY